MSKPIGYFNLDTSNPYFESCVETWGSGLEHLSEADRLYFLYILSQQAWQEEPTYAQPSEEVMEAARLIHDISYEEKINLIRALTQ